MSESTAAAGYGRFAGKVALVVGGGWCGPDDFAIGIGGAICWQLVREGGRVAVLDIEDANAERTLAPIVAEGGEVFKIVADTALEDDCERSVEEVIARWGRLDLLVNNVGIGLASGLEPGSQVAEDRIMDVNFRGELMMVKHAAPRMEPGSAIVNVSSVFGGVDPIPGAYAMSKRAVSLVVTPTLAAEHAPKGIRVNCVSVGYVWNAVTQQVHSLQAPDQSMEEYRRGRAETLTALRTEGDAWDVAKAVAFLGSDDARWITGQDLVVDGGYSVLNVFDASRFGRNLAASPLSAVASALDPPSHS